MDFDAIVVGSGISGGWVAKELCERGLKTLVIERGRHVEHRDDYQDFATPWEVPNRGIVPQDEVAEHYAIQSKCHAFNSATKQWWVRDSEHPYITPQDRPFAWIRGYHLGGRSITWGRQTYRMSDYRLHRQQARWQWRRLADSLRGSFAVVRPCRTLRRHLRRERRSRAAARRTVPAAAGTQLRRARVQAAHRGRLTRRGA